jgi:hypothetical protein
VCLLRGTDCLNINIILVSEWLSPRGTNTARLWTVDGSSCTIKQPAPVKFAEERHGDTKLRFAGFMFHLQKSYQRRKLLGSIREHRAVKCRCLVTLGGQDVGNCLEKVNRLIAIVWWKGRLLSFSPKFPFVSFLYPEIHYQVSWIALSGRWIA